MSPKPGGSAARDVTPFADVPINRLLGFELRSSSPEGATVAFTPRADFAQEYGVTHGGLLAALADTAAVYALHPFLEPGERMTSIEFKVNFLAPATAAGGEVVAISSVIRRGRTVAVVKADVTQAGKAVAVGLFTYIFAAG